MSLPIVQILSEAGVFTYLVVVAGLIGIVIDFLQLVLLRKFSLWPLILGSVAGTLLIGLLGALTGTIDALAGLETVQPSQRAAVMARGISTFINVLMIAALMAGVQALFGVIGVTIRSNIRKKTSGSLNM